MKKTFSQKPAQVVRSWHLVDAKGRVLGQVASEIALLLIGKQKPTFTPHVDSGDFVVVVNAADVVVTGSKEQTKMYYRHSGIPGGFKSESVSQVRQRSPELLISRAVSGMLPKNKHRQPRLVRLKVYAQDQHPHQSQLNLDTTTSSEGK